LALVAGNPAPICYGRPMKKSAKSSQTVRSNKRKGKHKSAMRRQRNARNA
jgi:hypothetical protein